jgi:hypothetical protein
MRERAHWA